MKSRNEEALSLSEEILSEIELRSKPLSTVALKCLRLARITNDSQAMRWLQYELYGYKARVDGEVTEEKIAEMLKKPMEQLNKEMVEFMMRTERIQSHQFEDKHYFETLPIPILEKTIGYFEQAMDKGTLKKQDDGTITIYKMRLELLDRIRMRFYEYALNQNYEIRFGNIVEDIFTEKRKIVEKELTCKCPEAIQELTSAYDNLKSKNAVDWANAVHSCRRILKELADNLYPPTEKVVKKGDKEIYLGEPQYINRLIEYVNGKSSSEKFKFIVGSQLLNIGERLASVNSASNKGSHDNVSYEEAERCIIYTYILVADILSL